MTLYKLLKMADVADLLRLHLPNEDKPEQMEICIALHNILWNKPYVLTLDVTEVEQYVENDNMVMEVWTKFGAMSYSDKAMLEKLGDNTKPTIEQALQIRVPSASFADDITLAQVNDISDMAGVPIIDVLKHIYMNSFAVELESSEPDTIEHEMDYREFTAEETRIITKYLEMADASAKWIDGRAVGFGIGRRYIVDYTQFGETECFASAADLLEGAKYCLKEWEHEYEEV